MSEIPILVVGDAHGDWRHVHTACLRSERPGVLILLGDLDLTEPLAEVLGDEIAAGWKAQWIIGNHDTDDTTAYDCLAGSLPDGDIGSRSIDIGGVKLGGLGGTFRERLWYPRFEMTPPVFENRAAYLRQVRPSERWRGGLPLGKRSAIFPEDSEALWQAELDVLVCHEAPSTMAMNGKGFLGIDELLDVSGARLCVHGHHHMSYAEDMVLRSGRACRVRGLAKGEVWRLEVQA
jgi:hypothetical protein